MASLDVKWEVSDVDGASAFEYGHRDPQDISSVGHHGIGFPAVFKASVCTVVSLNRIIN